MSLTQRRRQSLYCTAQLLLTGVFTTLRGLFAKANVNEWNRDITPTKARTATLPTKDNQHFWCAMGLPPAGFQAAKCISEMLKTVAFTAPSGHWTYYGLYGS